MIYVVTMYRYGHRQGHSYVYEVCSDEHSAKAHAECEQNARGGKYSAEIIEYKINDENYSRVVKPLSTIYRDQTNAICNTCGQVIEENQ